MNDRFQQAITQAMQDAHSCIQAAYIFGSRAQGRAKNTSDPDLAVVCTRDISGWERIHMETSYTRILCW